MPPSRRTEGQAGRRRGRLLSAQLLVKPALIDLNQHGRDTTPMDPGKMPKSSQGSRPQLHRAPAPSGYPAQHDDILVVAGLPTQDRPNLHATPVLQVALHLLASFPRAVHDFSISLNQGPRPRLAVFEVSRYHLSARHPCRLQLRGAVLFPSSCCRPHTVDHFFKFHHAPGDLRPSGARTRRLRPSGFTTPYKCAS